MRDYSLPLHIPVLLALCMAAPAALAEVGHAALGGATDCEVTAGAQPPEEAAARAVRG